MIIGHFQAACAAGQFERNLETVRRGLRLAADRGLRLVCFPECFLTGYWTAEADARRHAWPLESAQTQAVVDAAADAGVACVIGFNELDGERIHDTAMVIDGGRVLGRYRKTFPVMPYFTPGDEFPVFDIDGLRFGVIICADGGEIEPARILALKGAQVILAPHYNYMPKEALIDHYLRVRADHVARAVENGVWFVRANNVDPGHQPSLGYEGVGYGDSYILDPHGQIVAAAGLHAETLIWAECDPTRNYWGQRTGHSRNSVRRYWRQLLAAAEIDPDA